MTETFYDVLGVAEDATSEEIESAYRERLKETHPDVSDEADAGEATRRLVEARDVLVDEDERARYDRVGHAAYVGDEPVSESTSPADAAAKSASGEQSGADRGPTGASERGGARDRAARERRASQRVEQERTRRGTADADPTSETTSTTATDSATTATASAAGRRRPSEHVRADAADESATQYSVRQDVATPTSFGPILPTGHRLTRLGIFFALYPVLLFSTLLPAFPLLVNVVTGVCLLLTVAYLQSMPRVGLIVFGGWSAIAVVVLSLSGLGLLSLVGIAVLCGTVLPFALSVLTASALRF